MSKIKLPRTVAVVVESDVLGRTAFSVPAHDHTGEPVAPGPDTLVLHIDRAEIEDEIDRRETHYLDSLETGEVEIDRAALRRAAEHAVNEGDTTWDLLAADCGWTRADRESSNGRRGDGSKVRDMLSDSRKKYLTYDDANALVKALSLDPVDIGL